MGNLLPHPVPRFALFAFGVVVASALAAGAGLEDGATLTVTRLLSTEGMRWMRLGVLGSE